MIWGVCCGSCVLLISDVTAEELEKKTSGSYYYHYLVLTSIVS